ncbi:MAG TPA: hypothetical protein VKE22_29730 [Haliangiales bacterium]|nr:hypothetical protein [Haliangiales bacterium]
MYPDLAFRGSKLGESDAAGPPLKVGVQGTQKIKVLANPDDVVGILAFRAASSGAAISTGQLVPPNVTVLGNSQGGAYLRILDPTPGKDLLLGRTLIEVAPIASADIRPQTYQNDLSDMAFAADKSAKWVLFAGGTENVVVRLFDGSGNRLADEGVFLGVSGPPLVLAGAQPNWDTVDLMATKNAGSQGTVKIRTSDAQNRDQNLDIVTAVDQIIRVDATGATTDPSTPVKVGDMRTYCFRAMNNSRLVAGVTWLPPALANAVAAATSQAKNCVTITGTTSGTGILTVTAENFPKTFTLNFTR